MTMHCSRTRSRKCPQEDNDVYHIVLLQSYTVYTKMFITNTLGFLDHHDDDGCHEDDNKDDDE